MFSYIQHPRNNSPLLGKAGGGVLASDHCKRSRWPAYSLQGRRTASGRTRHLFCHTSGSTILSRFLDHCTQSNVGARSLRACSICCSGNHGKAVGEGQHHLKTTIVWWYKRSAVVKDNGNDRTSVSLAAAVKATCAVREDPWCQPRVVVKIICWRVLQKGIANG